MPYLLDSRVATRNAGRLRLFSTYARRMRREMSRVAPLLLCAALGVALGVAPLQAVAQTSTDSATAAPIHAHRAWGRFAAGFATSILAHEAGHVSASLVMGYHPTFGLDRGRPTVYSGIDPSVHRRDQFIFSSAGLDVQDIIDEFIVDLPHGGGAFQRGVLSAGIGTTVFYLTIGRTASVSDIAFIKKTSGLTSTQIALIYGGVAVMHSIRIVFDERFADFFVRPGPPNGLQVGVQLH